MSKQTDVRFQRLADSLDGVSLEVDCWGNETGVYRDGDAGIYAFFLFFPWSTDDEARVHLSEAVRGAYIRDDVVLPEDAWFTK